MGRIMELKAVYHEGVLRPLKPLELPENQQVTITVRLPGEETPADTLAGWRAVYAGLSEADVTEIEAIALDRSHFMPEGH
jgi:predicted DNA-binding antitoxin AbrB/MazE fold protein